MKEKNKNQKAFIQIPILIGALLVISVTVVASIEVVKHKEEIKSAVANISSTIFSPQSFEISEEQSGEEEIITEATPLPLSDTNSVSEKTEEVDDSEQQSLEVIYKEVVKEVVEEVSAPAIFPEPESKLEPESEPAPAPAPEPEPESQSESEAKTEPETKSNFCVRTSDCPQCQYCNDGKCVDYCRGTNTTSCGCDTCVNCNNLDGCYENSYRDYYCRDIFCVYDEDDCSDCSCSCGGYDIEENNVNKNCSDSKDNDCDGAVDWNDSQCIKPGTATVVPGDNNPVIYNTQKVGITDFIVSSVKITAGSAENITIQEITWTQYASADISDMANIKLVNNYTEEVLVPSIGPNDKTITFSPNITINKGASITFDIKLDIINGSSKTISWDIDQKDDILIKGELSGCVIIPDFSNSSSRPYFNANDTIISEGTLTVSPASISISEIVNSGGSQVLGAFDFTVKGEPITISQISLRFNLITNNTDYLPYINQVAILSPDGYKVAAASKADVSNGYVVTMNDSFSTSVGTNTFRITGHLVFFVSGDTIQVELTPKANITAIGDRTAKPIIIEPSTAVTSVTQTVK